HGDRCSRLHTKPTISPTIVLLNMYQRPDSTVTVEPNDTRGYSNFMHLKKISRELRHKFFGRFRRRHSRSISQSPLRHRSYEDYSHKSHSRKFRDDSEKRRARIEQWNREKEQEELDNMDNADINYKNESNENEFAPNKDEYYN
ncbi:splicing factor U2af small subunit A-like, partial [Solanum stenotomum]|uniref:splicing factor U2af small subunit A-like n=1 Tax=Solanum stenotomum TaxID=172797 RepID=UPI0020D009AD